MKEKPFKSGEEAKEALLSGDLNEVEYDPVHIILHLKQRMDERGLTQTQLSEMSGVRQATISQLTRGNVERLHIPTLEKLAQAMDITDITQLITFEPESEIMNMSNPFNIKYKYGRDS